MPLLVCGRHNVDSGGGVEAVKFDVTVITILLEIKQIISEILELDVNLT